MKPYRRAQRVGEEIQRVLAEALAFDVRDPRLSGVTLLRVDVSSDLKTAKVFFIAHDDPERAQEGFSHAKGFLRGLIAKRMEMRLVPDLRFQAVEESSWIGEEE